MTTAIAINRNRGNRLFLLICTAITLLYPACSGAKPDPPLPKVELFKVSVMEEETAIFTGGTVQPGRIMELRAPAQGQIAGVLKEIGDSVPGGTVLGKIVSNELETGIGIRESSVKTSRERLELAEHRLLQVPNTVEAGILELEKISALAEAVRDELEAFNLRYESRRELFLQGGISKEIMDSLTEERNKLLRRIEQTEREYKLREIGFRDIDIETASLPLPGNDDERITLLTVLHGRSAMAERNIAMSELDAAISELESLNQLREKCTITAPFDASVLNRFIEEGQQVDPGSHLYTLISSGTLKVPVLVGERQAGDLFVGMKAELVSGRTGTILEGSISALSPTLNTASRNRQAIVLVNNHDGTIIPGEYLEVTLFPGTQRQVITVPGSSIIRRNENGKTGSLYIFRNGRIFSRNVEIDPEPVADGVRVISGLEEGELVCTVASLMFRDGIQVEVLQ